MEKQYYSNLNAYDMAVGKKVVSAFQALPIVLI
jgi:hypothetical protein